MDRVATYTDADELDRFFEYGSGQSALHAYARFGYDADSRIDWRYRIPQPQEVKLPTFDATYDIDNRVATWNAAAVTHDLDGNMTSGPLPGVETFASYNFDARNRLTSVGDTSYFYDAENNRIAKTDTSGTTSYVIDPHGDALPRVLVREKPDGTLTRYVYDIGLLYMRARYYSPELKRFINSDPARFDGGMNWYAYANNSPLMYVDANGEHPILVLALIGGISNVATGAALAAVTGQEYGLGDAAMDFGIGAVFGCASGATIKAARFYSAARFTTSSRSWKWSNVSPSLKRPKWGLGTSGQDLHHWLIPRNTWGSSVPNRIKNQPWNLMSMKSKPWHQAIHGKGLERLNLPERLWHGSPAWARVGAVGAGVALGNHGSRTTTNWSTNSSSISNNSSGFNNISTGGNGWK